MADGLSMADEVILMGDEVFLMGDEETCVCVNRKKQNQAHLFDVIWFGLVVGEADRPDINHISGSEW